MYALERVVIYTKYICPLYKDLFKKQCIMSGAEPVASGFDWLLCNYKRLFQHPNCRYIRSEVHKVWPNTVRFAFFVTNKSNNINIRESLLLYGNFGFCELKISETFLGWKESQYCKRRREVCSLPDNVGSTHVTNLLYLKV